MLKLKDGLILYHGSYCEVKEPDLAKCAKFPINKGKSLDHPCIIWTKKCVELCMVIGKW